MAICIIILQFKKKWLHFFQLHFYFKNLALVAMIKIFSGDVFDVLLTSIALNAVIVHKMNVGFFLKME